MTSVAEPNDQMASSDATEHLMDHLLATHKLEELHSSLYNSLSTCGWTERVRHLALELFRNHNHHRFEDVVDTIVSMATSGDGSGADSPASGKRKRDDDSKLANGSSKNGKRSKHNQAVNGGDASMEKGIVKTEAAETTETGIALSSESLADYKVQIPERAVSSGVKFLHDSMHELFASDTESLANGTRRHDPDSDDDTGFAVYKDKKKTDHAGGQAKTNGHPPPKSK